MAFKIARAEEKEDKKKESASSVKDGHASRLTSATFLNQDPYDPGRDSILHEGKREERKKVSSRLRFAGRDLSFLSKGCNENSLLPLRYLLSVKRSPKILGLSSPSVAPILRRDSSFDNRSLPVPTRDELSLLDIGSVLDEGGFGSCEDSKRKGELGWRGER